MELETLSAVQKQWITAVEGPKGMGVGSVHRKTRDGYRKGLDASFERKNGTSHT
jgi:hypothetical protein